MLEGSVNRRAAVSHSGESVIIPTLTVDVGTERDDAAPIRVPPVPSQDDAPDDHTSRASTAGGGIAVEPEVVAPLTDEQIAAEADSMFVFGPDNGFRRCCTIIDKHTVWRVFVMVCILVNSVLLAADQPDIANPAWLQTIIYASDIFFTAVFGLEMCIRVVSLGFIAHKGAYLRDPWNRLDFVIVVTSIVSLFGGGSNLSSLRVFRVLRPLRSVQRVKPLKALIGAIFDAIPIVMDNMLLFLFILVLFAISGVVLYAGVLTFRCYATELKGTAPPWPPNATWANLTVPLLVEDDEEICGGTYMCPNRTAEYGFVSSCQAHRDLFYQRNLNFDHLFASSLLTLKIMTLDNWHEDLNNIMNAAGQANSLWFVFLTFLGAFICVNLFLAILTQVYHCRFVEESTEERGVQATPDDIDKYFMTSWSLADEEEQKNPRPEVMDLVALDDDPNIVVDDPDDDRAGWRKQLQRYLDSFPSQLVMAVVTVINVATLAIDWHGIDPDLLRAMDYTNYACTAVYVVFLTMTIVAEGWARTFQNGFNVLDAAVILVSVIDIAVSGGGSSSAWSAFRVFRLLRLARFLRIKSIQPFVRTIIDSVSSVGWLSLLILLFLYVYTITGMQVMGRDYRDPEGHLGFGTFFRSAMTAFIAITGDRWTDAMRFGMASYTNGFEIIPVVYFVSLYMIGNYILINLSVAIILDKLEEKLAVLDSTKEEEHPPLLILPRYFPEKKSAIERAIAETAAPASPALSPLRKTANKEPREVSFSDLHKAEQPPPGVSTTSKPRRRQSVMASMVAAQAAAKMGKRARDSRPAPLDEANLEGKTLTIASNPQSPTDPQRMPEPAPYGSPPGSPSSSFAPSPRHDGVIFADDIVNHESDIKTKLRRFKSYLLYVRPIVVQGDSFFVFSPDNAFRQLVITAVSSTLFDRIIDLAIIANIVFLCFESANNSENTIFILRVADYVFGAIFFLEMALKMIAYGVVSPGKDQTQAGTGLTVQEAYLRDMWNWVDFIVVVCFFLALAAPLLRASRALRAFRLMTRYEATKIIIVAVIQAVPHVLQGLIFVAFVFFVLGVVGVKLFKGRYYTCSDDSIVHKADCVGFFNASVQGPIFVETRLEERFWLREPYHFDHLGSALLSLFVVTVGDGWAEIMYAGMHSRDNVDEALDPSGPRDYMALYFIVTFMVCNFFALNMMIGILVSYFSKKKRLYDGSALLTPQQRLYVKARYAIDATLSDDLIPRETEAAEAVAHFLTYRNEKISETYPIFDLGMMVVICINTAMMASTYHGMDDRHATAIELTSLVALCIFGAEVLLKMFAYGVIQYFSYAWNLFDFTIVVFGIIGYIVDLPGLAVFRVLRVLKMIKGSGIEALLAALIRSVNSFINVTGLLLLTFFVFAVAGVIIFGDVKLQGALNINVNFINVPNAMLALYTVATRSGWAEFMDACGVEPPKCEPELGNCGNLPASVAYFMTFMIVCSFVVLQLFVAVVVEIFLDDVNHEDPVAKAFASLKEVWANEFGVGVSIVPVGRLLDLLPRFPAPLTDFEHEPNRADCIKLLSAMQVPVDSKFNVVYRDLVNAIAFRKYKVDLRSMAKYMNDTVLSVFGTRAFAASQAVAILTIQRAWRQRQKYLHDKVAPLEGVSANAWLRNARSRDAGKKCVRMERSEEMRKGTLVSRPAVEFNAQNASHVPTNAIQVQGAMLYVFPSRDPSATPRGASDITSGFGTSDATLSRTRSVAPQQEL